MLPKSVRSPFGITPDTPDTPLELVQSIDGVQLRRVADRPSMQRVDRLWVHQGISTADVDWNAVIDCVREERMRAAWAP